MALLAELHDYHIILDLAHASHQTALDALNTFDNDPLIESLPVLASHAGIYEVCYNPRNLPVALLKRIVTRGGLVGLYVLTFGLDRYANNLRAFVEHLRYGIRELGYPHIAIGSDAVYKCREENAWRQHTEYLREKLDPQNRFHIRWPDQPLELNRPDLMDVLNACLAARLGADQAQHILGKNFFEFLSRALPE